MPIFISCLYGIIGVFYIELVMLLSGSSPMLEKEISELRVFIKAL
jgi:hypothetical protein